MNNPPAFPVLIVDRPKELLQYNGMTLRDYFAAKANEEDIAAHLWKGFIERTVKTAPDGTRYESSVAAKWTREQAKYLYADAMLKAREQ